MARLQIVRKFSLAFLGKGFENGYINFRPFSIVDMKNNISPDIDQNNPDPAKVQESLMQMVGVLEEKFIDGKYPNEDGTLDDIAKEEIGDMAADIIQGAMNFLSQPEVKSSVQPSTTSLPQNQTSQAPQE